MQEENLPFLENAHIRRAVKLFGLEYRTGISAELSRSCRYEIQGVIPLETVALERKTNTENITTYLVIIFSNVLYIIFMWCTV